jgi:hypothetical protein
LGIGATCTLWLDGADTTQLVFSSGSNVNTWKDKSGFGNSCSNITAGTSITYPGTQVNGLNTVHFTAAIIRGAFNGASANTGTDLTMFMVAARANNSETRILALTDATYSDSGASQIIAVYGTSKVSFYRAGAQPTGYAFTINNPFLYTVNQTSGTGTHYFNGGSVETISITTSAFAVTNYNIGTTFQNPSQNYTGTMSEIIIYNALLGDTQRQKIEGYLAQKWGLTSQLPPGHPGLTQTLYNSKVYQSRVPLSPQPIYQNFNPKQLTGCQLWLDGADTSTVTFSSGSNVSQWRDKSGNELHATVFGGTPTYTLALGMTFNGSSTLQVSYTGSPTIETLFIIIKFNSVANEADFFSGTAVGQRQFMMYAPYNPGTIWLGRYGAGPSGVVNGGTVTTSTNYMLGYVFDGTANTISFYQQGSNTASGTPQFTYSAGGTITAIGSSSTGEYLQGQIYEIIVYNTALSSPQRQQVEGYLAWKWGLQNSLVNHPYKNVPPGLPWQASLTSGLTRLPPIVATGGTITFSGNFKIHTFTTVGTTNFTVSQVLPSGFSVQVLVVAGGGAGSGDRAAGGGAGGLIFTTTNLISGTYPAVVGAGGTVGIGNVHGTNGLNSSFNGQVAIGGGSGGSHFDGAYIGSTGGSGGGGAAPGPGTPTAAGGTGTSGQGYGGGTGYYNGSICSAGGGGGAGGLGSNATTGGGGNGGPGLLITIGGNSAYYAGGGGGAGAQDYGPTVGGTGGLGGGGTAGQSASINATPGTPNTGGGGAGAGNASWGSNASNGGSGIIIIAYPFP